VDNGGVGGDTEQVNRSGAEFDHEQDIEALQGNGVDAEEVVRENA
jgi:hypothetical protein